MDARYQTTKQAANVTYFPMKVWNLCFSSSIKSRCDRYTFGSWFLVTKIWTVYCAYSILLISKLIWLSWKYYLKQNLDVSWWKLKGANWLFTQPHLVYTQEIIASRDSNVQRSARWLASVYLKNSINRYWRFRRDSS